VQSLTEDQLADLYLWLEAQYPHTQDPQHKDGEAHAVTPDESVRWWRDDVLRQLQQRATPFAITALERLCTALPDNLWLPRLLRDARILMLRATWQPPLPEYILKLPRDRCVRLVQSADQLLDVVIESLDRLQKKLQGETYAAPFLWDEIRKNTYRPKNEDTLSDYVKNHLVDDLTGRGIIAGRELEIRRGRGNAPGEYTDIHIEAISKDAGNNLYGKVAVIVETKGCWNQGVKTAMETQLVDRYLKDNQCQHGLYLVGWFACPQWDAKDYRKKDTPDMDVQGARLFFDNQAATVSVGSRVVRAVVLNIALR
jgi:hypothetical protein